MDPIQFFTIEALQSEKLSDAVAVYKEAAGLPGGYLNTVIFQRMRDGTDDERVKRFFAKPFAEVRTWLPGMLGLYISRFPDHPYTYVVADNLSDEYGKYVGHGDIEPSHAELYHPLLDELGVEVAEGTMSTPAHPASHAASDFYEWFKNTTATEQPAYMLGHFLAYEITDVLDFPDYYRAAKRIWPHNKGVHEFFTQHAHSGHDSTFARGLQPVFAQNQATMVAAMAQILVRWTTFYEKAAREI